MHRGRRGHGDQCRHRAKRSTATTDSYGDFWLNDLAPGQYTLSIEKPGFLQQKIGPVDASKDVNVGDIAIWKA